ncbi:TIGR02647 family protein [Pseudomonas sp. G11-1]|uniref:TIGR02647 family protein n=1 Tax=Halopseudomonas bauzanensis TaxID=653930 RepID=A0A1I4MM81_9GAMM|nr:MULTISPECIES: TIGR02647 family protein [Halopseudomonas]MCO5785878.1 TIGR02647 family protein [Pseudomonas sp. G11-1]MCO5788018.1 TIGR02647 family protein [Pseudomonas sp. G11-2]TKA93057.1 TIGR02647 family protein [Halopseudomonas bauzanensis]WGK61462.1 TIGR02647 family protein [Halopseudomonas sp. SMJS2]SES03393.1 TIGR02647 family protein [Halopseudomonas bauzanensis]
MSLTSEEIDDINLLVQYDLANTQAGLKVHQREASATTVETAARLYRRGLTTMDDGGYLTSLGLEAAEHAQALMTILRAK